MRMIAAFCSFVLKTLGWKLDIDFPGEQKYVLIVAPHTSNWDFPLGLCASRAIRLKAHFIGKHTLFRKPFGWFFRACGGIPVERGQAGDLARQLADKFAQEEDFVLGLAPEGTRSKKDHWKSGFYHIARAAGVPIAMAYLDYGKKQIGLGGAFHPGPDIGEAYDRIRAFYRGHHGKIPQNESLIQARQR